MLGYSQLFGISRFYLDPIDVLLTFRVNSKPTYLLTNNHIDNVLKPATRDDISILSDAPTSPSIMPNQESPDTTYTIESTANSFPALQYLSTQQNEAKIPKIHRDLPSAACLESFSFRDTYLDLPASRVSTIMEFLDVWWKIEIDNRRVLQTNNHVEFVKTLPLVRLNITKTSSIKKKLVKMSLLVRLKAHKFLYASAGSRIVVYGHA